jgi:hypothetical protein
MIDSKLEPREKPQRYHAPVLGRSSPNDEFHFYGDMLPTPNGRVALDGTGIVAGKLVTTAFDLLHLSPTIDHIQTKGSLAIYSEIESEGVKHFAITPDPIGACLVYKYDNNGVVAFSSDLKHLTDWLRLNNIHVAKSVFYQALVLSINDGAFGYSSYEDIFALRASEYVLAYGNTWKCGNYGVEHFLAEPSTYSELFSKAKCEIKQTISIISESQLEKIAHLTGGMDSRLVVAAISAIGRLGDYKLFCSGQHGFPDFDTAHSLCGMLNARLTNKPSLIQAREPANIDEYYHWCADDNQGMLPNQPTNIGLVGNRQTIVLSGGYGECLRGYHEHVANQPLKSVIDNMWPLHDSNGQIRSLAKDHIIATIKSHLGTFLLDKLSKGWSLNSALQLMYLQEKNRYFVGNITLSFSRYTPRIDPLYSLFAFKAAYRLPFQDRVNKVLIYDLMNDFSPLLASAKFGTTSWSKYLLEKRFITPQDVAPATNVSFEKDQVATAHPWLNQISAESKAIAIRIGAPAWQVQHYPSMQEKAKHVLSRHPEIYEYFDKTRIRRLLNSKHSNRQAIRKVFQLYYALVWLYR